MLMTVSIRSNCPTTLARRAPRRHRHAIPAITPIGSSAPVSKTLPKAVRRIARELHPHKIILFGSYAYGNPTPDSDVDLLVVMKTNAPHKERYLAVSRLLRPRPFSVDIIVKTPQEIKTAIKSGDFFIEEIYTQGKVLYEQR
jgi:predicted nucleotidyltransferase